MNLFLLKNFVCNEAFTDTFRINPEIQDNYRIKVVYNKYKETVLKEFPS